jgi:cystathionine beta-synthase
MRKYEISQLPVLKNGEVVGGLSEITLIKLLYDGVNLNDTKVAAVMTISLPQLDEDIDISEFYRLLMAGYGGIIVTKNNQAQGFLAKMDFADFWINKVAKKEAIKCETK